MAEEWLNRIAIGAVTGQAQVVFRGQSEHTPTGVAIDNAMRKARLFACI